VFQTSLSLWILVFSWQFSAFPVIGDTPQDVIPRKCSTNDLIKQWIPSPGQSFHCCRMQMHNASRH
jgi:hypothetical protein